jgi:hypothetical protein
MLLNGGAVVCWAGTAAVIACAAIEIQTPSTLIPSVPKPATGDRRTSAAQEFPPLEHFSAVWSRQLRLPLTDPAAASQNSANIASAAPVLPIQLSLLGTALEPGYSMALFSTPQGGLELKSVGQKIGEHSGAPEIVEITADCVLLRHAGGTVKLSLPVKNDG